MGDGGVKKRKGMVGGRAQNGRLFWFLHNATPLVEYFRVSGVSWVEATLVDGRGERVAALSPLG